MTAIIITVIVIIFQREQVITHKYVNTHATIATNCNYDYQIDIPTIPKTDLDKSTNI